MTTASLPLSVPFSACLSHSLSVPASHLPLMSPFPCAQSCLSSTPFTSISPCLYFSPHFALFCTPLCLPTNHFYCLSMCVCVHVSVCVFMCVDIHISNLSVHVLRKSRCSIELTMLPKYVFAAFIH